MGQRACSFSLAASGVDADSIFEQARELGFPVQDEKLKSFSKEPEGVDLVLRNLKESQSLTRSAREKARGVSVWLH